VQQVLQQEGELVRLVAQLAQQQLLQQEPVLPVQQQLELARLVLPLVRLQQERLQALRARRLHLRLQSAR
jgi:hypothetical protein